MNVTKEFIYDKDISIGMIVQRLEEITKKVHENNRWNLTDINIICECIYGSILNRLFDLELISTSAEISSNYAAVDLVDFRKGVAFQVTSRNDIMKIKDTVKKFKSSRINQQIQELNIMIIGKTGEHREYKSDLNNGNDFSLSGNVYDHERLIKEIEWKSEAHEGLIVEIYDDISKVFDCGRLDFYDIEHETDSLSNSLEIEDFDTKLWKKGVGDVQLTAYIPISYKEEVCCLLELRKQNLSGMMLTLNEETLKKNYFVSLKRFTELHSVGRWTGEQNIYLQIENVRLLLNAHTAYKLYQLFDEMGREYEKEQEKIAKRLGTAGFHKINSEAYKMMTIKKSQWDKLTAFAKEHDYCEERAFGEWFIFNNSADPRKLILSPNHRMRGRADILAELSVVQSTSLEEYDVIWSPGWGHSLLSMEGFDTKEKWKMDDTYRWFTERLIPAAEKFCKDSSMIKRLFRA